MKKIINILLSCFLIISLMTSLCFAQNQIDVNDFEQITASTTTLLNDIENEKEMYELSQIDFDNLYISEHIPAYILKSDGYIPSEVRYYPILENGNWVTTIMAYRNNYETWNVQLSSDFIKYLPEIHYNDELALIFDNENAYLQKNGILIQISSYNEIDEPLSIHKSFNTQKLTDKQFLSVPAINFRSNSQFYFDFPKISQQPQENGCLATSLLAISEFYNDNYTIQDIYAFGFPENPNAYSEDLGMNTITARLILSEDFGYTYIDYSEHTDFETITSLLSTEIPILSATVLNTTNPIGHCIVLRGYTKYNYSNTHVGSISFMNPWTGTYQAGSVTNDDEPIYSYVASNGTVQNIALFTAVYE